MAISNKVANPTTGNGEAQDGLVGWLFTLLCSGLDSPASNAGIRNQDESEIHPKGLVWEMVRNGGGLAR